jgi:hypothetical protein
MAIKMITALPAGTSYTAALRRTSNGAVLEKQE